MLVVSEVNREEIGVVKVEANDTPLIIVGPLTLKLDFLRSLYRVVGYGML